MRRHHRSLLAAAAAATVSAGLLSPATTRAATDLTDVLGVTHIDGKYYFTNQPYMTEGAEQVLATGTKVIKLEMGESTPSKYSWNTSWPTTTSLTQLAQTPSFQSVFSMPFNTYVMTTYTPSVPGGGNPDEYWLNGVTPQQAANEQQSFYNLTKYLMQTYAGTGKTFVLEQWEGDWALRDANHDRKAVPTQQNVQGMIDWLNAREAGIQQARAELAGASNVTVLGAVELNRVEDAMKEAAGTFNEYTVTNDVLPYTHMDLASYSSYDTEYNTSGTYSLANAVNYIASKLPATAYYGQNTHSVGIGEFGVPEVYPTGNPSSPSVAGRTTGTVNSVLNNVVSTVKSAGLAYAIDWEIYSNEYANGVSSGNVNGNDLGVNGYAMVRPDGTPTTAWHQYRYQFATADPDRATAAEVQHDGLHLAYASDFNVPGATLGPAWSTNTSSGAMTVGLSNGQVQMTTANPASTPVGQATLNIDSLLGRGLRVGEYLQFTLNRQNNAGIVGLSAFGVNHGSGIAAGNQPLEAFGAGAWNPFSLNPNSTDPATANSPYSSYCFSYNWNTTNTLGLQLTSADGHFATISYYLNGAYAGSWLYQTASTALDNFSLFAQSNTAGAGFSFNNLALYTTTGGAATHAFRWDPAHTNSSTAGGTGTWDAASAGNFYNGASDVTWNYATLADSVTFAGTPGTVTVSGNVTASTLTFDTPGYTLTGGTLTMMGNQTLSLPTPGTTTLNTTLAGPSGLTVTGPGTASLAAPNTFTGGLWVAGGATLAFTADNNLGALAQPVTLDGGALSYRGNVNSYLTETRTFTIGPAGGAFDVPNPASAPTYGKLVVRGTNHITGAGPISKTGQGWLTIYGSGNDATGDWSINGGVIELGTAGGLGSGSVTINAGGELSANTSAPVPNPITLNTGGTLSADFGSSATGTFAGPVTVNGNANLRLGNFWNATSQNVNLTGNLAGHGALTILPPSGATTSTGRLTLTGDNAAFSGGFVIPTGTVAAGLSSDNTLGTGPITLAGGKLSLQGHVAPTGVTSTVAPVAVTGFNKDTLYAATETSKYPSGDSTTNTLMDGSFSFYQSGFTPPAGSLDAGTPLTNGLPGTTFTSTPAGTPFSLQPLTAANTLQINQGAAGTLSLATPTAFTRLAVLATSSWGATETPTLTISFSDGTTVDTTYKAFDWYAGTDPAKQSASAFGPTGIERYGPTQSPGWDQRPFAMYETDIDLTNIAGVDYSDRLVTVLTFAATTYDTQGRGKTDVFAVSGAARSWTTSPTQSYATPVTISADSSIDITGSLAATLGPLTLAAGRLAVTSADPTAAPYSLTFAGPTSLAGNATLDVARSTGGGSGTVVLGPISGTGSLTKTGPGALRLAAGGAIPGGLTLSAGSLSLGADTSLGRLSISPGATLDTSASHLTINYTGPSPAGTVRSYLFSHQLFSSSSDPTRRLAYFDTGSAITVTLTLTGDANLDGQVTPDDYALLDRGFASHGAYWWQGDFNYDGQVDQQDYLLIDTTLGQAHGFSPAFLAEREAQFGPAYVAALQSAIPEPSTIALAACAAATLAPRRRRPR